MKYKPLTVQMKKDLEQHEVWLKDKTQGKRLNWSNQDLSYFNLSNKNLQKAYLVNVNLSYANLSYTNLSRTFLWDSNLSNADLSESDLCCTILNHSNLSNASLYNTWLHQTKMEFIKGKIILFFYGPQFSAYYCDNYIKIGCRCHTIKWWIRIGEKIGQHNDYTNKDIKLYMNWIRSIKIYSESNNDK